MQQHSPEEIERETDTLQFRAVLEFFGGKREGVFIELGAIDGICGSNTFRLERDYGWNGILIEPISDYYDALLLNRKASHMYRVCVCENEGETEFTRIEGYSKVLSGIPSNFSPDHKNRIDREVSAHSQQVFIDKIASKKMSTILSECGINQVDYLSVDVEGAELSVIKSIEMEKNTIRPILIGAENNYGSTEVWDYLSQFGYNKINNIGGDDFFYYDGEQKR